MRRAAIGRGGGQRDLAKDQDRWLICSNKGGMGELIDVDCLGAGNPAHLPLATLLWPIWGSRGLPQPA